MRLRLFAAIAVAGLAAAKPVQSQNVAAAPAAPQLSYADLADLALAAPIAAHLRIRGADALRPDEAPNLAPGFRRFLVQADVVALIRGEGGLAQRVSYLVDLPADSRGRPQRIRRGTEYLLLASRVPNRPAELRLVARDGQLPYSAGTAARVRELLRESLATGAPPAIVGIGRAFHVPGSLPGESETQFFLLTADQRPISLSVLRRPGERPRWSVALGEMVDNAAAAPQPNTLLWYRLACTLPASLPQQSLAEASPEEAEAIRADYRLVIERLGRCERTRVRS